ncbi:hypothetical protein GJ744_005718 [Endocarpon pusillum]|uniref:Uncharacterized protein n=1 Tax=Endocarpon pusillum TaxID=364733 RepID=A0A8H7AKS7_9EURO|nr:hypothetical protein GJ744_005718 [Endocarpon pusillum]
MELGFEDCYDYNGWLDYTACGNYLPCLPVVRKSTGAYWSHIALSNWIATSVVISAVVIRTSVTIHTTLSTSLLALATMKTGVALHRILRVPIKHTIRQLRPARATAAPPWMAKHSPNPSICSLVHLAGILTILLQPSSTPLVADLAPAPVETFANVTNNAVMPTEDYAALFAGIGRTPSSQVQ